MRVLFSMIALAVFLAGCGYKTPLALPKPKTDAKAAAQKPAPADAETKPATEP